MISINKLFVFALIGAVLVSGVLAQEAQPEGEDRAGGHREKVQGMVSKVVDKIKDAGAKIRETGERIVNALPLIGRSNDEPAATTAAPTTAAPVEEEEKKPAEEPTTTEKVAEEPSTEKVVEEASTEKAAEEQTTEKAAEEEKKE